MRDSAIIEIVKAFNKPVRNIFITSHAIGANVHFGEVWLKEDFHTLGDVSPYRFYFILNAELRCVGAVLDMTSDLHWVVLPKERKKGYLTLALKNAILPHLSHKRKEQRITINCDDIGDDNFRASVSTAAKAGFKIPKKSAGKIECKLKLLPFKATPISPSFEGMTYERMAEIRKHLNEAVGKLWKVKSEVQMRLGTSHQTRELDKFIDELSNYRIYKLEDMLYDFDERRKRHKNRI